jgi:hypothetical protein
MPHNSRASTIATNNNAGVDANAFAAPLSLLMGVATTKWNLAGHTNGRVVGQRVVALTLFEHHGCAVVQHQMSSPSQHDKSLSQQVTEGMVPKPTGLGRPIETNDAINDPIPTTCSPLHSCFSIPVPLHWDKQSVGLAEKLLGKHSLGTATSAA